MENFEQPLELNCAPLLDKFSKTQLHSLFKEREVIKQHLKQHPHPLGFADLPYQKNSVDFSKLAEKIKPHTKDFLIIGIGGSNLGAKAAIRALGASGPIKIHFLDNPNPAVVQNLMDRIDWKQATVNVISKSGTTLETLSLFFIIYEQMKKVLTPKQIQKRLIVTSEYVDNFLCQLAKKQRWTHLAVPKEVTSRYSVLSSAGLFPMAMAGISITELLQGAQWVDQNRREAYLYATLAYGAHRILEKPLTVLFLYDERLTLLGDWFCQIWAESLAKSETSGPTPLKAIGAIDQHSLLQLFLQGPSNKWYTMVVLRNYGGNLCIPKSNLLKGYGFLKKMPLEKFFHIEQQSTEQKLTR